MEAWGAGGAELEHLPVRRHLEPGARAGLQTPGLFASATPRAQVPVLHLPRVVEHVVCAVPDHELDRPGPRRHPAGVVIADRRAERVAVGAEIGGASPGVVWREDADLLRELLDLGAVRVARLRAVPFGARRRRVRRRRRSRSSSLAAGRSSAHRRCRSSARVPVLRTYARDRRSRSCRRPGSALRPPTSRLRGTRPRGRLARRSSRIAGDIRRAPGAPPPRTCRSCPNRANRTPRRRPSFCPTRPSRGSGHPCAPP